MKYEYLLPMWVVMTKFIKIEILNGIGERIWGLDRRIGTMIVRSYFPIINNIIKNIHNYNS